MKNNSNSKRHMEDVMRIFSFIVFSLSIFNVFAVGKLENLSVGCFFDIPDNQYGQKVNSYAWAS